MAAKPLLRAALLAGAGLGGVGLSGCVHLSFSHESFDEPLADAVLQQLRPGQQDLGQCLLALGAPHRVFEYRSADGERGATGMALLWVWRDVSGWGFDVSSPSDSVPGSFEWSLESAELPGCVLWFGADLMLERWRSGRIGALLPLRVRPSVVQDD